MAEQERSFTEYQQQLAENQQLLNGLIDRVYASAKQQQPREAVQLEFQRAVDEIMNRFFLQKDFIDSQRTTLSESEYNDFQQRIEEQYKEQVVLLSAAVDTMLGNPPSVDNE